MAADEPRFDIPAIVRAAAVIIGGTAVFGFAVPALITALFDPASSSTTPVVSNVIFTWAFWGISWGLTLWQGAWMLRGVGHDRILDDVVVLAVICAVVLLIVKIMIALIYEAESIFTGFDVGGALVLLVVALIGARANRF
jgi:hypothetical protein